MKIKINSDDNFPVNKQLNFLSITIIIRSIFEEDGKYYPRIFLDECLHEEQKFSNMKELIFLKELILISQINQKNV